MSEELVANQPKNEVTVIFGKITDGLKAFEERKAALKQLVDEAAAIQKTTFEDKAPLKKATEHRKKIKAERVKVQNEGKAMRDPLTAVNKEISGKEKELVDLVSTAEKDMQAIEDWYEAEQKRLEEEERQKEEQRIQGRIDRLLEYGFAIDINMLKAVSDDDFDKIVESAKSAWENEQAAEKERQRLQKEKDEQAEKDKVELQKLRDRQAAADKIIKGQRVKIRTAQIEALGMGKEVQRHGIPPAYVYADVMVLISDIEEREDQDWDAIADAAAKGVEKAKERGKEIERVREVFRERILLLKEWSTNGQSVYAKGRIWGTVEELVDMSDEVFKELVSENDAYIRDRDLEKERLRNLELEEARVEGIGKGRRLMLKAINGDAGVSDLELGGISTEQWERDFEVASKLYEKRQKEVSDQQEADRLAAASDKEKIERMIEQYQSISHPEMKSAKAKKLVTEVKELNAKVIAHIKAKA